MASVAQDLAFGLALLIFSIAFVLTGFLILGIVFAAIVLLIGVIVFIAFLLPTILFFYRGLRLYRGLRPYKEWDYPLRHTHPIHGFG